MLWASGAAVLEGYHSAYPTIQESVSYTRFLFLIESLTSLTSNTVIKASSYIPIGTTRGRRHGTEKLISGPLQRNRGPCALPFLAPRLCHASDQQELLPGRPFTRPQVAAARSPSSTRSPDPFGQRITRRKKPSSQQLASHHLSHHRIPH
jgi:hypothetical protein